MEDKYKTKYLKLKNNNLIQTGGGNKFKIIIDEPTLKYVKYNGKNTIHTTNTMDDEILNEKSEFMIFDEILNKYVISFVIKLTFINITNNIHYIRSKSNLLKKLYYLKLLFLD